MSVAEINIIYLVKNNIKGNNIKKKRNYYEKFKKLFFIIKFTTAHISLKKTS